MRAVAVTALALLAAGCGSSGRSDPGPPPTPTQIVRGSLAAAAASPGAQYDLVVDAKLDGKLPPRFQAYVKSDPHARADGTIGRDLFTAHVSSSIPQIALLTGDEVVAGPRFAYLRFQGTWYGSKTQGLAHFWRQLPSLLLARPATEPGLLELLDGAIHGSVGPGPSLDGVDTWELAGPVDPRILAPFVRPFFGSSPQLKLAKVAARSRAAFDVGRDDRLPRRVRVDLHVVRADFGPQLARQFPELRRVDAVLEVEFSAWGDQRPVARPQQAHTFDEYLSMRGLGN